MPVERSFLRPCSLARQHHNWSRVWIRSAFALSHAYFPDESSSHTACWRSRVILGRGSGVGCQGDFHSSRVPHQAVCWLLRHQHPVIVMGVLCRTQAASWTLEGPGLRPSGAAADGCNPCVGRQVANTRADCASVRHSVAGCIQGEPWVQLCCSGLAHCAFKALRANLPIVRAGSWLRPEGPPSLESSCLDGTKAWLNKTFK